MWDVNHTEFWTDTIEIGRYIWDVKGVTTGFQPLVFLPWNFSGFEFERRAAGLLAAPLAQGFFLAVVGLMAFGVLRARSTIVAFLVSMLCFYGIYMSSTRGAMLAFIIGTMIYFAYPWRKGNYSKNLIILAIIVAVSASLIYRQVMYTISLTDGSTIGHLDALEKNFDSITNVILVGSGIGAAGGQSSSMGLDIEGGGEGAIFSIAYQMGVPCALVFLWYYYALFMAVYAQRHAPGRTGELSHCLCGLFLGVALSMVTSEHILTFSGMGAFWFSVGGFIGYTRRMGLGDTPTPHPTPSNSTSLTVV
jgi:hypothetical protein